MSPAPKERIHSRLGAGRLAGWQAGRLAGWQAGRLAGWLAGRLAGWLDWLDGRLITDV